MRQTAFTTISALSALLHLTSAQDIEWDDMDGTQCQGLNETNFNATYETSYSYFSHHNWTWHTGLVASDDPKGEVQQHFWVDTHDDQNLNSLKLEEFQGCGEMWMNLPESFWEQMADDSGSCDTALGKECTQALRDSVKLPDDFDYSTNVTCQDIFFGSDIPEECDSILGKAVGTWFSLTRGVGSQNAYNQSVESEDSCPTTGNEKGENSVFLTLTKEANDTLKDYENYDSMAKGAYILVSHFFNQNLTDEGSSIFAETGLQCFRNENFSKGSRVPKGLEAATTTGGPSQPTSTSKPKSGGAANLGFSGFALTMAISAFVLLV